MSETEPIAAGETKATYETLEHIPDDGGEGSVNNAENGG